MSRGDRLYHAKRVKVRRLALLWNNGGDKPWQALNRMGGWLMRDPGRWEREMMIRPARAKAKNMMRHGEYDGLPDYRKPVIYYW